MLMEKYFRICHGALGVDHADTLRVMSNLAWTYSNQGKWDDAMKLNQTVLDASIQLLGADHPNTLTAMANLALTCSNQGKWDNAMKLEQTVLDVSTKVARCRPSS